MTQHPARQRRIAAHTGIIAQEAQGQDEQHALPPGERHDRDRRGQLLHQPDRAVHHREQPVEQPCHTLPTPPGTPATSSRHTALYSTSVEAGMATRLVSRK